MLVPIRGVHKTAHAPEKHATRVRVTHYLLADGQTRLYIFAIDIIPPPRASSVSSGSHWLQHDVYGSRTALAAVGAAAIRTRRL